LTLGCSRNKPFHSEVEGNDRAELPRGEQTFAKVKFKIGASLNQLTAGAR
jgi:hypothetical protein